MVRLRDTRYGTSGSSVCCALAVDLDPPLLACGVTTKGGGSPSAPGSTTGAVPQVQQLVGEVVVEAGDVEGPPRSERIDDGHAASLPSQTDGPAPRSRDPRPYDGATSRVSVSGAVEEVRRRAGSHAVPAGRWPRRPAWCGGGCVHGCSWACSGSRPPCSGCCRRCPGFVVPLVLAAVLGALFAPLVERLARPRGAAVGWCAARAARPHGRRGRLGLAGRRRASASSPARSRAEVTKGLDTLSSWLASHGVDVGSGASASRRARVRDRHRRWAGSLGALSGTFSSLVSLGIGAAIGAFLVYYVIVDWDGPDPMGGGARRARRRDRHRDRRRRRPWPCARYFWALTLSAVVTAVLIGGAAWAAGGAAGVHHRGGHARHVVRPLPRRHRVRCLRDADRVGLQRHRRGHRHARRHPRRAEHRADDRPGAGWPARR